MRMELWWEAGAEAVGEIDWPTVPRLDDHITFNLLEEENEQATGVVSCVHWKQSRLEAVKEPILRLTLVPLEEVETQE